MYFVSYVTATLLCTNPLVVSGLVGKTTPVSELFLDGLEIKRNIWQVDGSSSGSDIKYWSQEKDPDLTSIESHAQQLMTASHPVNNDGTCSSCCKREPEDCPEHCSCWNSLQNETPGGWKLAGISAPPERAHLPGPGNQYCSSTLQSSRDGRICPYPCRTECPCYNYCVEAICVLVAWRFDSRRYPCVRDVELLEMVVN